MSRKLQVGDWVRDSVGGFAYEVKTDIYVTHWESRIRSGHAVRVYVRDVKTRKVKASELWAWLYSVGGWIRPAVAPSNPKNKWACWWSETLAVAGETPTLAIIQARKVYRP